MLNRSIAAPPALRRAPGVRPWRRRGRLAPPLPDAPPSPALAPLPPARRVRPLPRAPPTGLRCGPGCVRPRAVVVSPPRPGPHERPLSASDPAVLFRRRGVLFRRRVLRCRRLCRRAAGAAVRPRLRVVAPIGGRPRRAGRSGGSGAPAKRSSGSTADEPTSPAWRSSMPGRFARERSSCSISSHWSPPEPSWTTCLTAASISAVVAALSSRVAARIASAPPPPPPIAADCAAVASATAVANRRPRASSSRTAAFSAILAEAGAPEGCDSFASSPRPSAFSRRTSTLRRATKSGGGTDYAPRASSITRAAWHDRPPCSCGHCSAGPIRSSRPQIASVPRSPVRMRTRSSTG